MDKQVDGTGQYPRVIEIEGDIVFLKICRPYGIAIPVDSLHGIRHAIFGPMVNMHKNPLVTDSGGAHDGFGPVIGLVFSQQGADSYCVKFFEPHYQPSMISGVIGLNPQAGCTVPWLFQHCL